jgi:hypothetical protein
VEKKLYDKLDLPSRVQCKKDLNSLHGKVKLSPYRQWRPLGLREVEAPTFSDIRLIYGDKVVSPKRRPLFTPQEDSWYSFLLEAESTPGPPSLTQEALGNLEKIHLIRDSKRRPSGL